VIRIPPAAPAPVVTGMGVLCAIGRDLGEFERSLRAGRCGVKPLPDCEGPRSAALLEGFDLRAALSAWPGLPEALSSKALAAGGRGRLPAQAALHTALQAWLQAGLHRAPADPERVGLIVAGNNFNARYAFDSSQKFRQEPDYLPASYGLHFLDTDLVGMLSEALGIRGPGFTVGAASASGNLGLIQARQAVLSGSLDACLVVGALAELSPMEWHAWKAMGATGGDRSAAADGSRPFDAGHAGFVYGQGSGAMVIESAASAHGRGAAPLAVLAGGSACLDGNRGSDPDAEGEARAMRGALRSARVEAGEVDYLNAHGSSSALGDRTEAEAIRSVFRDDPGRAWVNSTKGLAGHCLFAAGVVEAIATVIQMRGGFVHPNPNLDHPIDAALRFAGKAAAPATLSHALSNSFGFGGINSSILLSAAGASAGPKESYA
jgi:malonyl-ACP decarboxylase